MLKNERAKEAQEAKVAKGVELAERFVNTSKFTCWVCLVALVVGLCACAGHESICRLVVGGLKCPAVPAFYGQTTLNPHDEYATRC